MRGFLIFVIVISLGYFFLRHRQNQMPAPAPKSVTIQTSILKPAPAAAPSLTPAPRGQASEYNYMKRALDRAADVRDQARTQTREAQDIHP